MATATEALACCSPTVRTSFAPASNCGNGTRQTKSTSVEEVWHFWAVSRDVWSWNSFNCRATWNWKRQSVSKQKMCNACVPKFSDLILLSRSSNSSRLKSAKDLLSVPWKTEKHFWEKFPNTFSTCKGDFLMMLRLGYLFYLNLFSSPSLHLICIIILCIIYLYIQEMMIGVDLILIRRFSQVLKLAKRPCGGSFVSLMDLSKRPIGIPGLWNDWNDMWNT